MVSLHDALASLPGAVFADFLESDTAYLFVIDLPGATKESTEIHVEKHRIRVIAEQTADTVAEYEYLERGRAQTHEISFPLPRDAREETAEAEIARGVLELRLPKTSESIEQEIPIEDD